MSGTIAFFDAKPYDRAAFDAVNADYGFTFKYFDGHLSADTAALAKGAQTVCIFVNDRVDRAAAEALDGAGVRLIALRCAGYNNVDLKAVYRHIHVCRVPAYSPYAVAEHAMALMLTLNRKTHRAFARTRDSNFSINGLMGFDMHGKTLGVIGTGKIGQVLIGIARGFGMDVVAFDKYPDEAAAERLGFTNVPLDDLYARADIISLHCPLTEETEHIIGTASLGRMKDGVMIINTGRGALIDSGALIDAVKARKVGAAGLDVYEEETDYFFEDHSDQIISDDDLVRLVSYPNVLVTSHQGFFTREAMENIARTTLENITAYQAGTALPNEVCYRCGNGECRKEKEGRCF